MIQHRKYPGAFACRHQGGVHTQLDTLMQHKFDIDLEVEAPTFTGGVRMQPWCWPIDSCQLVNGLAASMGLHRRCIRHVPRRKMSKHM